MTSANPVEVEPQYSLQSTRIQFLSNAIDAYFSDIESTYSNDARDRKLVQKIFKLSLFSLLLVGAITSAIFNTFPHILGVSIGLKFTTGILMLMIIIILFRGLLYFVTFLFCLPRIVFSISKTRRYLKLNKILQKLDFIDLKADELVIGYVGGHNMDGYLKDLQ